MQPIEVYEYRCRRCEQRWDPRECYSPEGDVFTLQDMSTTNHYKRAVRLDPVEAVDAGIEPAGPTCPCCRSQNIEAIAFDRIKLGRGGSMPADLCPIRDIPLDGPPLEAAPCLYERCGFFVPQAGRCGVVAIAGVLAQLYKHGGQGGPE